MGKLLCKLWMFILKAVDAIIDGVMQVIDTILGVLIDLVSMIWTALKSAVSSIFDGSGLSLLTLGLLGLGAWWLLGGSDNEEEGQEGYQ